MKRTILLLLCLKLSALPAAADTDSATEVLAEAAAPTSPGAAAPSTAPSESGIPTEMLPKIRLTVEPPEVAVGELMTWKLDIDRAPNQRVHLPSSASFGDLEIHSRQARENVAAAGRVHEVLEVRLIGFEAGQRAIPPLELTVVDEQGRLGKVEVEPAVVNIKSLIANEPEPRLKEDTGPGVDVYQEDLRLLYVGMAILAVLAVAGLTLLGRWLWNKRRPKPAPPPPPPRPAEEIAREKLEALKRSDLLDKGEIKQFYILLSEALREYLGNRYGFDSLEMSTEELLGMARRLPVTTEDFHDLRGLLEEMDLVKFAKYLPPLDSSRELLARTEGFVERTTPKNAGPVSPPTGGGAHAS
jgi:hypothetical protein